MSNIINTEHSLPVILGNTQISQAEHAHTPSTTSHDLMQLMENFPAPEIDVNSYSNLPAFVGAFANKVYERYPFPYNGPKSFGVSKLSLQLENPDLFDIRDCKLPSFITAFYLDMMFKETEIPIKLTVLSGGSHPYILTPKLFTLPLKSNDAHTTLHAGNRDMIDYARITKTSICSDRIWIDDFYMQRHFFTWQEIAMPEGLERLRLVDIPINAEGISQIDEMYTQRKTPIPASLPVAQEA